MGNNSTKENNEKNNIKEINYSDLDPKKNYCLICPECKTDKINITYIEYNKELDDYMCKYDCQYLFSKDYESLLINLLKESEEQKYISYKNIEILEEILENKNEFGGYKIIENIIKKSKIKFLDNLKIKKEYYPIKKIFWVDDNIKNEENKKYIEIIRKEFNNIFLIGMEDLKNLYEIIKEFKYEIYIIIIKGKMFTNYIDYLTNNSIYNIPV